MLPLSVLFCRNATIYTKILSLSLSLSLLCVIVVVVVAYYLFNKNDDESYRVDVNTHQTSFFLFFVFV